MDGQIEEFLAWVRKTRGVDATVDRPDDPAGVSFIDIRGPSGSTQVSFQPSVGFGIFSSNDVFGQRPYKLVDDPRSAAVHVLKTIEQGSDRQIGRKSRNQVYPSPAR